MSTVRQVLIVSSVVSALATSSAAAQGEQIALAARSSAAGRSALDPRPITVADAQRLYEEGRFREAERAFKSVLERQQEAGEYPAEALRRLAQAQYARDDERGAAETFDRLAEAASRFGDPETRIHALLEAAILYQHLHENRKVAERVPVIKSLLQSPVISVATREEVARRVQK